MVFLVLTRQAVADLTGLPMSNATAVWVNPGVLTNEELAQLRASGVNVTVLPHVLKHTMPGEIQRLAEEIRRSHGETIWIEHPTAEQEDLQPTEAPAPEGVPAIPPLPPPPARRTPCPVGR